jgi:hypothetical protein
LNIGGEFLTLSDEFTFLWLPLNLVLLTLNVKFPANLKYDSLLSLRKLETLTLERFQYRTLLCTQECFHIICQCIWLRSLTVVHFTVFITFVIYCNFSCLTSLTSLNLSYCQLGHQWIQATQTYIFTSLTNLNLSCCTISDEILQIICAQYYPALIQLNLSYNRCTDQGLKYLTNKNFPSLSIWYQIHIVFINGISIESNFNEFVI